MAANLPCEQLVFSGGGLRCFWHGGFLEAVEATHRLRPTRITGCVEDMIGTDAQTRSADGPTLVLLSKRFVGLPDDDGGRITYAQPSKDLLPGRKLDFTDPDLLTKARDQGRDDGRRWRSKIP